MEGGRAVAAGPAGAGHAAVAIGQGLQAQADFEVGRYGLSRRRNRQSPDPVPDVPSRLPVESPLSQRSHRPALVAWHRSADQQWTDRLVDRMDRPAGNRLPSRWLTIW